MKISARQSSYHFCPTDLAHCHAYLVEMSQLLQSMDVLHRTYSAPAINAIQVSHTPLLFTLWCSSAFLSHPLQPFTNSGTLPGWLLPPHSKGWRWPLWWGLPHGFGVFTMGLVALTVCFLSCFETKGGAFESPKKEKRSHRRWRSRAISKDAKGTLQVTDASPNRLVSSRTPLCTPPAGGHLDGNRRVDK